MILESSTVKVDMQNYTLQSRPQKEDPFSVVKDSGASNCIRFDKNNFVEPLTKVSHGSNVTGIVNGVRIESMGYVVWSFIDINGQLRTMKLPEYYIPKVK